MSHYKVHSCSRLFLILVAIYLQLGFATSYPIPPEQQLSTRGAPNISNDVPKDHSGDPFVGMRAKGESGIAKLKHRKWAALSEVEQMPAEKIHS